MDQDYQSSSYTKYQSYLEGNEQYPCSSTFAYDWQLINDEGTAMSLHDVGALFDDSGPTSLQESLLIHLGKRQSTGLEQRSTSMSQSHVLEPTARIDQNDIAQNLKSPKLSSTSLSALTERTGSFLDAWLQSTGSTLDQYILSPLQTQRRQDVLHPKQYRSSKAAHRTVEKVVRDKQHKPVTRSRLRQANNSRASY